jgi:glutamyl-tRNA reductase
VSVVVIGLQHTQAPLPLLEATAVADGDVHKVLSALSHRRNIQEAVVLSTCLRTEVYAVVDRFHDAVEEIYGALSEHSGVPTEQLSAHAVIRFDDDVTTHLFSVAAGLESVVMGETEIAGQVRRAFQRAQDDGACGPVLSALFRHALQTGKRVRTETGISAGTTSFAHAAVEVARGRDRSGLRGARVVVVGAGEMGTGICRALADITPAHAPARVVVANRSATRAGELVRAVGQAPFAMHAVALKQVGSELADADVVLSAVASEAHVLREEDVAQVRGPLLVIDLGVPRNVDPAVGARSGITLLDMDVLSASVARALGDRQEESVAARGIVASEVERFRTASRQRGAAPIISSLRGRLESLRMAELERHRAQLADLTEEEWEQVDAATKAVLAKMLHEPTMLLKETAGTPRGERLVEALRILFDL